MRIKIKVRGGQGGDGCVSFRHLKRRPLGGPDGGDGGDGGSVLIIGDKDYDSLNHLDPHKLYKAGNGQDGSGNGRKGKSGKDLIIRVPPGTLIHSDDKTGMVEAGDKIVLAQGGKGGRGNMSLRSSTNRLPERAEPGCPGEDREIYLEYLIPIDVAIIGKTNSGKSSLLKRLTGARPQISDLPFTTKRINLGTIQDEIHRITIGEIPSLNIEDFTPYLKRAKLVVILVDITSSFSEDLKELLALIGNKERIIVFSKVDQHHGPYPEIGDEECLYISGLNGQGFNTLKERILKHEAS